MGAEVRVRDGPFGAIGSVFIFLLGGKLRILCLWLVLSPWRMLYLQYL